MSRTLLPTLALMAVACGPASGGGDSVCGITALAGSTMLLDRFSTPQTALSVAPMRAPEALPARIAAGPVFRSLVTANADSSWSITVEGVMPNDIQPGFGVLVVNQDGSPRGIMLYVGQRITGAPIIGQVAISGSQVPLIGLQTDMAGLEDARCPFFPDSLARP